ncbi:hypothetical protein ABLN64_07615, partial [Mycobacterium tuberculosis]
PSAAFVRLSEARVFSQNDFHTRVSFRIYRETLAFFICKILYFRSRLSFGCLTTLQENHLDVFRDLSTLSRFSCAASDDEPPSTLPRGQ